MYTAKKGTLQKPAIPCENYLQKNCLDHPCLRKELWHITTEEDQGGPTSEEKYDNEDQLTVTVKFAIVWVQTPLLFLHSIKYICHNETVHYE